MSLRHLHLSRHSLPSSGYSGRFRLRLEPKSNHCFISPSFHLSNPVENCKEPKLLVKGTQQHPPKYNTAQTLYMQSGASYARVRTHTHTCMHTHIHTLLHMYTCTCWKLLLFCSCLSWATFLVSSTEIHKDHCHPGKPHVPNPQNIISVTCDFAPQFPQPRPSCLLCPVPTNQVLQITHLGWTRRFQWAPAGGKNSIGSSRKIMAPEASFSERGSC